MKEPITNKKVLGIFVGAMGALILILSSQAASGGNRHMNRFIYIQWVRTSGLGVAKLATTGTDISANHTQWRPMLVMAFAFGFFQALMPFIGWMFAKSFSHLIESVDHWIAFAKDKDSFFYPTRSCDGASDNYQATVESAYRLHILQYTI